MSRRLWIERVIALLIVAALFYPAWRIHESRKACVAPAHGFKPQPGDC